MTATDERVKQLKELCSAEKCDDAWINHASLALGLPTGLPHKNDWNDTRWLPHWGEVFKTTADGGQEYIVWERPDGGELVALFDERNSVSLIRCALLGELSETLKGLNKLSYVKVGFPETWNRARVTIDGTIIENVTEADALFGKITVVLTDERGKPRITKDEFATGVMYGNVEISVQDKAETLF